MSAYCLLINHLWKLMPARFFAIQLTTTNNSLANVAWFTSALLLWVLTVVEWHAIGIVVTGNSLARTITCKKTTE